MRFGRFRRHVREDLYGPYGATAHPLKRVATKPMNIAATAGVSGSSEPKSASVEKRVVALSLAVSLLIALGACFVAMSAA